MREDQSRLGKRCRKNSLSLRERGGVRGALLAFLLLARLPTAVSAEQHRLENGTFVVVEPRPSTETVAVRSIVGGGNLDEPPGRRGISRLHAALLLRGTAQRSGFALARAAEELGGRLTSSSRPLAEIVSLTVPAENAEAALRLVVEAFLSPRLDAADLEKEKTLLIGALATERDQPSTHRRDEVYRAVFGSHPLSRLALPSDGEIRSVRIEDVRAFHRSRLEGPRIALLVVGRCEPSRMVAVAREVLKGLPIGAASVRNELERPVLPPPAPLPADVERRVKKRTTQPEMTVALPTDGLSDAQLPAFALLSHILGGFQERLYQEIREKHGWAYAVDAGGENFPGAGLFEVTTGAKKEHFTDIERVIRKELERAASSPVTPEELLRAVRYRRTAEARRDATNAGRANVLTEELLAGSPLSTYEERVARLAAVKPEEIPALAHRLFAGKHVALITMY